MEKIKIIVPFRSVPTRHVIENSKTKPKKFNKLKYTIMASFQAKIGWKRCEREKIKIFVPFHSYPMHNGKFQKNSKKIRNIKKKKTIMTSFQAKIC